MSETLCSVGLDVGTTTTQMIVSRLQVQNRASGFAVPRLEITGREIVYESPIHFTPLQSDARIDGEALRQLVEREYEKAGLRRENVDTGAVIVTGETSRKENARTVAQTLSHLAGDFVVTTAGPDLESALAARGSGAVDWSEKTGKTVLHFDIGGGTANWALIRGGNILQTGCLNVGGRLVKFDPEGVVTYVSPVVRGLTNLQVGERVRFDVLEALARLLSQALEMAALLRPTTAQLAQLITAEGNQALPREQAQVISFSGGVADCIEKEVPWMAYGDLGPILGKTIRESRLCQRAYRLGSQTIRATVIGAGCHSTQLSGSTVYYQNIRFPLQNLPVAEDAAQLKRLDTPGLLALGALQPDGYEALRALAGSIAGSVPKGPVYVVLEADRAQALGHLLALELGKDREILCLDGLHLAAGDYLDVGAPVGPALPVVVKTLVFSAQPSGKDR